MAMIITDKDFLSRPNAGGYPGIKIIITSTVLQNMGDAAIFFGLQKTLELAYGNNLDIFVFDSSPASVGKYYDQIAVRPLLFNSLNASNRMTRFMRSAMMPEKFIIRSNNARFWLGAWLIKKNSPLHRIILTHEESDSLKLFFLADIIISTGGTYLVENYSLKPRILDYKIANLFKKPLLFFTQSLGPFRNTYNQDALRPIFNCASLILLRDERSRNNLLEMGVNSARIHVVDDGAFTLVNPTAIARSIKPSNSLRIAISLREWRHFKNVSQEDGMRVYLESVRDLTEHLVVNKNAEIKFISTCQGIPDYQYDDSAVALQVYEMLPETIRCKVQVDRDFHNPQEYQNLLQDCDLLVATRMHAAILALGVGVPVVAIEYEFKTHELFKRLGQQKLVLNIEDLSPDRLINKVNDVLLNLDEFRQSFRREVTALHKNALDVAKLFPRIEPKRKISHL